MPTQPRITGLIDSELAQWRAQTYAMVNPQNTCVYSVIQIGSQFWYTKAINAGPNSTTLFVGPWDDFSIATAQMNAVKIRDGF